MRRKKTDNEKSIGIKSLILRSFIKQKLAIKKISYNQVALAIDVSTPTIKRWMNRDDIPFGKLNQILDFLQIDLRDVATEFESKRTYRGKMNLQIETFIAENPKAAFVLLQLMIGFSFSEIKERLQISDRSLEKYFLLLDRNALIEYINPSKIYLKLKPPFRFEKSGPFAKAYHRKVSERLQNILFSENYGFNDTFQNKPIIARTGEMYLTEKSLLEFKVASWELIEKFRSISRVEQENQTQSPRFATGYMIGIAEHNIWKDIMWDGIQ